MNKRAFQRKDKKFGDKAKKGGDCEKAKNKGLTRKKKMEVRLWQLEDHGGLSRTTFREYQHGSQMSWNCEAKVGKDNSQYTLFCMQKIDYKHHDNVLDENLEL